MRSSQETYMDVAERCSAYELAENSNCFCNAAPDSPSCLNCKHFAKDEHCTLDLYDAIAKKL